MPGRDGTGPMGKGSRTGRGMGNCRPAGITQNDVPNNPNRQTVSWGGRLLDTALGLITGSRRGRRVNRR